MEDTGPLLGILQHESRSGMVDGWVSCRATQQCGYSTVWCRSMTFKGYVNLEQTVFSVPMS